MTAGFSISSGFDRRSLFKGLAGFGVVATIAGLRPANAQQADLLRVIQPFEFRTLRLADAGYAYTRAGIVETLVAVDPQGRIVPAVAESWSVSDDARTWRFRIRAGVTFHDGTACDAAAVKASFERLLPSALYLRQARITSITATGQEVVFSLQDPFGPFLAYLIDNSMGILSASSFNAAGEVTQLVGTGPYRVTTLEAPRAIDLARNETYWGRKAGFTRARYEAVTNGETRANIAIAGDADLVFNVPAQAQARIEAAATMRTERTIIPRVHVLMPNCGKPQFADARTRRALSMSLDRQAMATAIMRNPALNALSYFPPALADWTFTDLPGHRQDVAGANALLDQMGWARGADGIRARDGVRFAGTLRTFANRPELPVLAAAMQQQFRAVGYEMTISVGEFQAIVDGQKDGTLDMGLSSRNLTIVPDPIGTVALDFTTDTLPPGAAGATNWRNDEIRAAVRGYLMEGDGAKQAALRREIVRILNSELPVIPVSWFDQIVAVNRRVAGFINDPFEQRLTLNTVARAG
jgi:peptide/nickel transport system substrate-binding protein